MHTQSLKQAAAEIHQAVNDSKTRNTPRPFFFMIGAGVSHPRVPLASRVTDQCKEIAYKNGKNSPPPSNKPIDIYQHWLEQAYPQPRGRQKYFRGMIENAAISPANFRLAHLLLDKTITNLVVTTNFDDLLFRALTLFGERPIVCDHPETTLRIDPESDDLQIVQVHGSHWFYDCCNLKGEIQQRAQSAGDCPSSMRSLLDHILRSRSPIVVGYGGWEEDVFMSALRCRLKAGLATNLYWFCHSTDDQQALPAWLTGNSNVRIVAPNAPLVPGPGLADPPTIDAVSVFEELIRQFKLSEPKLTKDPLGFFTEHLHHSLDPSADDKLGEAPYFLGALLEDLKTLSQHPVYKQRRSLAEQEMNGILGAVREARYEDFIALASKVDLDGFQRAGKLSDLIVTLYAVVTGTYGDPNSTLAALDHGIEIATRIESSDASDQDCRIMHAIFLLKRGATLCEPGQKQEKDPVKALTTDILKFKIPATSKDRQEEEQAYDSITRWLLNLPNPRFVEDAALALFNAASVLAHTQQYDWAILAFSAVADHTPAIAGMHVQRLVAASMSNKGRLLFLQDRFDEAIQTCDKVVQQFGDSPDRTLQAQVARALVIKGISLANQNRLPEAVAAYDELIKRTEHAPDPALQSLASEAKAGRQKLAENVSPKNLPPESLL